MHSKAVAALRWSGLLAWLLTLLPVNFDVDERQSTLLSLSPLLFGTWCVSFLGFGFLYWYGTRHLETWLKTGDPPRRTLRLICCGLMTVCALTLNAIYSSDGDMAILLVLMCALLPGLLPWASVRLWILLQSLGLFLVLTFRLDLSNALYTGIFLGVVQYFSGLLIHLLSEERIARRDMAEMHIELRFARAQLEMSAREAERLRISRELHDSLGHHLTVLGLELELAVQVSGDACHPPIERARALNKLLLSDVRESVSTLRNAQQDWLQFNQTLLTSIPGLNICFDCPPHFTPASPAQAQTLLRFFQEAMTNTVRHARAAQLWLRVEQCGDTLMVSAQDDGQLMLPLYLGNGLLGLRERFEELGGVLDVRIKSGESLHLEGQLPGAG